MFAFEGDRLCCGQSRNLVELLVADTDHKNEYPLSMRASVLIVAGAVAVSITIYMVRWEQLANEHSKGDPFPQSFAQPPARSAVLLDATNATSSTNQSKP